MCFEEEIKKQFNFLFEQYGFKILGNVMDQELSGFVVTASGRGILLRFIKDRADFFLDVSSEIDPENRINFYELLGRLKDKGLITQGFKASNKINNVKSCLKRHFKEIETNLIPLILED